MFLRFPHQKQINVLFMLLAAAASATASFVLGSQARNSRV